MGGRPGSIAPYLRIGGLIALSLAVALLVAASIGGDEIADDTTVLRRAESVLGTTTLVDLTARETLANARTWSHGETTSDQLDRANAASADMVGRLRDQTSRLEEAVAAKHGLGGSSIAQSMADLDRAAEEMATAIDARRIDEAGQVAETRLEPAIAALMTKVTSLRDDREAHIASVSEGLGLVVDAGRFLVALTLAVLVWTLIVGAKRLGQKDTLPTSLDTEIELHRKREVFLAAASHHINTPLTGVVGLAELLEDRTRDLNGGVRSEIIDLLAIQARETAHVVDDILVAARSDLSELIVFEDKVDVRRVVEQAISGIGSTLRSRVTIRGHGIADADRKWVEHIVRNLIRNAGSYGGENIGVRIHTVHSKVVVDVADDGDGLPTGAEDVVFRTPYYQQLDGLAPSLGLGLLVARTLARSMGGDLAYMRDAEQSVFRLSLPVGRDANLIALPASETTVNPRANHPTRAAIEQVLAAGGPSIIFEPVVDLRARQRGEERVFGYEALSRFDFASPPEWFDVARASGLQLELDLTCVHAAVAAFASNDLTGCLAINVHDATLMSSRLLEALEGLDPSRTVVELSETASIRNYERAKEVIDTLRRWGIRLAIDDVGSGEIDMWHILRLQPAIIKIDRSLVCDIDSTPRNRALIRGLTSMASELGMLVVCEGVQSKVEEAALLDLGVRFGQGYLFGPPAPPGRSGLLSTRSPLTGSERASST